METTVSLLKQVELFKELNEDELRSIADIAQQRRYHPGQMVFMQGEELDRVCFVQSGKVKVYKTDAAGKEQIVSVFQPGDMFPHVGFFHKGAFPAHAEIVEETVLAVIPIADFERWLIRRPQVCIKLFRVMSERILDLHHRLEEQILHSSHERILMLLIRLSETYGTKKENGEIEWNTSFTNQELANMIGTSRETVSRTLAKLKKQNKLKTNAQGCLILNKDTLYQELEKAGADH